MFSFRVVARSGRARAGLLETPHGVVETPVFMPVGTAGAVKAVTARDLAEVGARILLANTYHLMLRPGDEVVRDLGGLHGFAHWDRAFLTDSGGYQVLSLAGLREVEEEGVRFRSHLDGSEHFLSPERSMEIQMNLGADIVMALDECPAHDAGREAVEAATQRTTRWARRCREAHKRKDQWLFGILQGGVDPSLREASSRDLVALDFPGYALGGLAVGEARVEREGVLDAVEDLLPPDRPRYLMGVGTPEDLVESVHRGIDMFDCVLPTRNGRNGQLFTSRGKLSVRNARYKRDERPPDPGCSCYTCRTASRAYLRHLHLAGEMTAATLLTIHNLAFYLDTLRRMREHIVSGQFEAFRRETLQALAATEPS